MSTLRVRRALSSLIAAGEIGLLVALAPGQVNAQVAQPGSKAAARPVPAAGAQAKAKAEAIEVEEMVVTARHRAELITETPVVITAVTGEQIEEKGIYSAEALAQLVPNVYIHAFILSDIMVIRGVGAQGGNDGFDPQIGLFIDGVYYGNGHWVQSGFFDLDNVQILKGPQGVYFGKNTIAGAIDIHTKSPGKELEGDVKIGYDFYAKERYGQAAVSVPITDKISVRVAGRASQMDGWANVYGKDEPGSQDLISRMTVAYRPLPEFDATYKLQYNKYKDNGPDALNVLIDCPGNPALGIPPGKPAPLRNFGKTGDARCERSFNGSNYTGLTNLGESFVRVESWSNALNMHYRTGDFGELTSITGFNTNDYWSVGEFAQSNASLLNAKNDKHFRSISQEVRYLSTFDFPVNFLAGMYYQYTRFNGLYQANVFPVAFQKSNFTWNKLNEQMGTSLAGFGEVQWKIIPSLELDAGLRYTEETKHSTVFNGPNPDLFAPLAAVFRPGIRFEARQTFTNTSPQVSLTWKPMEDVMLYTAYRSGFLSGGFNHTNSLTVATQQSDMVFGLEKTKGGEAGAKFSLFDRRVKVNVNGYYYRYDGLQVTNWDHLTTAFAVKNAAETEVTGFEINGGLVMGYGFNFYNSFSYNRARYINYIGPCVATKADSAVPGQGKCNVLLRVNPTTGAKTWGQDFGGTPTDQAPDWAGRVEIDYAHGFETPFTGLPGSGHVELSSSVGANWTTEYLLVAATRDEPSNILMDANLSLQFGSWTAGVLGRNLLNEVICQSNGGRALSSTVPAENQCTVGRSREVHLTLAYSF